MKRTFLTLLLFAATLSSINSQAQSPLNENDLDKYISNIPIPKNNEIDLVGTPYSNESFQKGSAVKNGITIDRNIGLRYNASKDVFEIKKPMALADEQARILKKTDELSLIVNNETYVFLMPTAKSKAQGYFVVLFEGDNLTLYKKIKKEYIPAQKAYSSMAKAVPPTYKEKIIYFLADSEGAVNELSVSKKKKTEAFGIDKKELKTFLKENSINVNKEKDLIKLAKHADAVN